MSSLSRSVPDGVGALFSREQMVSCVSGLPFPAKPIEEVQREAFHQQFMASCRSIANGLAVYGRGKDSVYKYHFSPSSYRYPDGFDMKWLKPFLPEIVGADGREIFLEWFRAAFLGFREIRLVELGAWDYRLEIDLL